MDLQRKIYIILIVLFSILAPILGFTLGIYGDLFLMSVSRIAGDNGLFLHLFFLLNCVMIILLLSLTYLKKYHNLGNKISNTAFIISYVLIEISIITPYIPHELTILANIHNYCSYGGVILIVLIISYLIYLLFKSNKKIAFPHIITFIIIVVLCLSTLFITGNPSCFTEILFITLSSLFFIFLIYHLHKSNYKIK